MSINPFGNSFTSGQLPWYMSSVPVNTVAAGMSGLSYPVATTTSSSSSTACTTMEELEKLQEKKEKQIKQIKSEIKELNTAKKETIQYQTEGGETINASISDIEQSIKTGKKNKDGSIEASQKTKNLTFGQKIKRAGSSIWKGLWDTIKGLAGFEKDGSWNWKKCLTNVAVVAGTVALCVFAAPVGAAVGTALTSMGLSAGAASAIGSAIVAAPKVIKAATKIMKPLAAVTATVHTAQALSATTTKEMDESFQKVGGDLFMLLSARSGSKGLSKMPTMGTVATAEGTASTTATSGNLLARAWGGIKNFGTSSCSKLKNLWNVIKSPIKSWRAHRRNDLYEYARARRVFRNARADKKSGFYAVFKEQFANVARTTANTKNEAFNAQKEAMANTIKTRLDEIRKAIKKAKKNSPEKAALQEQKKILDKLNYQLNKAQKAEDWGVLQKAFADANKEFAKAKWYRFGKPKVGDVEVPSDLALKIAEEQKALQAQLKALATAKADAIKAMAKPSVKGEFTGELNKFGFNYWNPMNRVKVWHNMGDLTWGSKLKTVLFTGGFALIDPVYVVVNPISNTPYATFVNGYYMFNNPIANGEYDLKLTSAEVKKIEDEAKKINDELKALETKKENLYNA